MVKIVNLLIMILFITLFVLMIIGDNLNVDMVSKSKPTNYYVDGIFGPKVVYVSEEKFEDLNVKLKKLISEKTSYKEEK